MASQRQWEPIIRRAVALVLSYTYLITLRQLHYLLVMTPGLGYHNTQGDYKRLSSLTAEGRRDGTFPALLDQTRTIHRPAHWDSPAAAIDALRRQYRLDRTEGQECLIVLGGEKATLLAQLNNWFNAYGMPVVLVRGYGSQTYVDDVAEMVTNDGRKAMLIYAGDMDASGEDILRDFTSRCDVWDDVIHIAVRESQIRGLGLVVNEGKAEDSRANAFIARYPDLHIPAKWTTIVRNTVRIRAQIPIQIEVEAIRPDDLRDLYQAAIDLYFDQSAYDAVMAQEEADKKRLEVIHKTEVRKEKREGRNQ